MCAYSLVIFKLYFYMIIFVNNTSFPLTIGPLGSPRASLTMWRCSSFHLWWPEHILLCLSCRGWMTRVILVILRGKFISILGWTVCDASSTSDHHAEPVLNDIGHSVRIFNHLLVRDEGVRTRLWNMAWVILLFVFVVAMVFFTVAFRWQVGEWLTT